MVAAAGTSGVAKKKTKAEEKGAAPTTPTRQINFRIPASLADRLDGVAAALATDVSHLLRTLIAENILALEARARRAQGLEGSPPADQA
jgi:hypothetical protein